MWGEKRKDKKENKRIMEKETEVSPSRTECTKEEEVIVARRQDDLRMRNLKTRNGGHLGWRMDGCTGTSSRTHFQTRAVARSHAPAQRIARGCRWLQAPGKHDVEHVERVGGCRPASDDDSRHS